MKDLKIKPGMDTPKAKLKNPAPKDADSLLKKHMDKRQREKEPESHDPVRYATDRVEKNMRHGASGAADASRRMIKHYRGKLRQGKDNAAREYRVADMGIGAESGSTNARNMTFPQHKTLHETKSENRRFLRKIPMPPKTQAPPRRSVGGKKLRRTQKPPIGGTLPRKEQRSGTLYLHRPTVEVQRPLRIKAIRAHRSRAVLPQRADRS